MVDRFLHIVIEEKGKVRIVVAVVFSLVDQLLMRSLGLEQLPINNKTSTTTYHHKKKTIED